MAVSRRHGDAHAKHVPPDVGIREDVVPDVALLEVDAVGGVERIEAARRPRRDERLAIGREAVLVERVDRGRRGVAADLDRAPERPASRAPPPL